MSYIPFTDPNVAAGTLSNLAVYRQQVTIPASPPATALDFLLFTTEAGAGQFVAQQVWFHVDDNSSTDTVTFVASIGHNSPSFDNICASATRGSASLASQLQQYKAVAFSTVASAGPVATATATASNTATGVYLRVSSRPTVQVIGTVFVVGYYTGMRA